MDYLLHEWLLSFFLSSWPLQVIHLERMRQLNGSKEVLQTKQLKKTLLFLKQINNTQQYSSHGLFIKIAQQRQILVCSQGWHTNSSLCRQDPFATGYCIHTHLFSHTFFHCSPTYSMSPLVLNQWNTPCTIPMYQIRKCNFILYPEHKVHFTFKMQTQWLKRNIKISHDKAID